MNIFVLDKDPLRAARYHNDKHVSRMILDSAQMLCDAHYELDGYEQARKTIPSLIMRPHAEHPCTVWAREALGNYDYLYVLLFGLLSEFETRFRHKHYYYPLYKELLESPQHIANGVTPWILCMPQKYRQPDIVKSYRDYYFFEKQHLAKWSSPAKKPDWWIELEEWVQNEKAEARSRAHG